MKKTERIQKLGETNNKANLYKARKYTVQYYFAAGNNQNW